MRLHATLFGAILLLLGPAAEARVTRIEILQQAPFAGGEAFGEVGPYEKIVGRIHGELDPAQAQNAGIVDLDKAPRNARHRVEYSADLFILRPHDLTAGNGALLYDVNNRGNKRALIQFNDAPPSNDPTSIADAGNGFLMREGFTVVWSGWIPGEAAANNALRIEVPVAKAKNGAIEQQVWDEFLFNNDTSTAGRLSFPAASTDKNRSTLLVRGRNGEPPAEIARDQWEFVGADAIRLLPAGTKFHEGAIYQLSYPAKDPPVAGIGFAATRDLVAFLRHAAADDAGTANPLAPGGKPAIGRALAHGTSQSGRYLRDFLYRGFNEDEAGNIVFDGINPHVATGRLFLDFRFAEPDRMLQIGHGFVGYPDIGFPWAYQDETDPFTKKTAGILDRCAARNTCPKVMHTVSATEYWESAQSLVTTDPLGKRDADPPDNVRIYHIASTQHVEIATMPKGVCALPMNPVDRRPVLRALLLALDRWVKDDTTPPPSRYPRLADKTLVPMAAWDFLIPGVTRPEAPAPRPRLDYGPDFAKGIIGKVPPQPLDQSYAVLVPRTDADGNEIGGVRLPDIAVPLGTATGWAVRDAAAGGAGALCYLDGSYIPFPKTRAERALKGDTRRALDERYADPADYAAKVRQAAVSLQREGYLLPEDVERIAAKAATVTW